MKCIRSLSLLLLTAQICSAASFEDVNNLFNKLGSVGDVLDTHKAYYAEFADKVAAHSAKFDVRDAKRKELFDCVTTKLDKLGIDVNVCKDNKDKIVADAVIEHRDLNNQINTLSSSTATEINGLQVSIDAIDAKILELRNSLGTLSELNEDRVNQIIADLNIIRSKYAGMLIEREKFFNNLNNVVARVQAYNATDLSEVNKMKAKYCVEEGEEG